ncbi:cytochrome P450, partial [Lipomyces oligophaga]|uniref:cytochrome P450 n=1 Tax=Lipomyces oligophaga TaxID=45792 RepID=UPI0034CED61F
MPAIYLVLLIFLLLFKVLGILRDRAIQRLIVRTRGAQPVRWKPSSLFGWHNFQEDANLAKEHKTMATMEEWFREYGPTYAKLVLGTTCIYTCEAENLEAITTSQVDDFDIDSASAYGILLGNGIVTAKAAQWAHARDVLTPPFTRDQLTADMALFLEKHSKSLGKLIDENKGNDVDMQDIFSKFSLDTLSEYIVGESTESLSQLQRPAETHQLRDVFSKAIRVAQDGLQLRAIARKFSQLLRPKWLLVPVSACQEYADYYIKRALAREGYIRGWKLSRYVVLNELVRNCKEPVFLRDNILSLFFSGRDTTSSLLVWVFYVISRRLDVQTKLRKEVAALFGSGKSGDAKNVPLTLEMLKKAEYLQAVINETLRLYPPIPVILRVANKPTTLPVGGGPDGESPILILKGQEVYFSLSSLQRSTDIFGGDAGDFKPERWIDSKNPNFPWTKEFRPFISGPRDCFGESFARFQTAYIIVKLLQEYSNIIPADRARDKRKDDRPARHFAGTLIPESGLKLKFV